MITKRLWEVNGMTYVSQDYIDALKSPIKELYLKIQFYDHTMKYIEEFTQRVTSNIGNLSVDSNRPIRRSVSLTLDNSKKEFIFNENKLIWLNKRIKIFTGLKTKKNVVEFIPQGVFILTEPINEHTTQGNLTTINCVDKAYLYTDKRGKILDHLTIAANVKITDAIKTVAQGETLFNFDPTIADTLPFELTYEPGTNRWQILQELADRAKCKIYYDVEGRLRLKQVDLNEINTKPSVWSFNYGDSGEKFYAGNIRKLDADKMYNHIRVLGGKNDIAEVIYDLVIDETDPSGRWINHPYSIQRLGKQVYFHNNGNPDFLITDINLAKYRAKYELMKSCGFDERISLSSAPLFILEADDVITIKDEENGVTENKYLVESFNLPLSPQLMDIECLRANQYITDWNFM